MQYRPSKRRGLGVLRTLLLVMLRSRSIITLALVIVIPISITTVLILGSEVIQERVAIISDMVKGTSVIAYITHMNNTKSCVVASVTNVTISNGEESIEVLMMTTGDVNKFLDLLKVRVIKSLGKSIDSSLGIELARILNLSVGKHITVCLNNSCMKLIVDSIHSCRCILDYSLIVRSNVSLGQTLVLLEVPRKVIASSILVSTSKDLTKLMYVLSFMTIISYIVLIYLGFKRLALSIRNDVFLIHEIGITLRSIRLCFAIAATALSLILTLYGTALGLVITHSSIWVLRFFNVYLPLRPTLPYLWLTISSLMMTAIAFPIGYITSRGWEHGG